MGRQGLLFASLVAGFIRLANAQGDAQADPYVPEYVDCPANLAVRDASEGLSDLERGWRYRRASEIIGSSLKEYLKVASITDFDIDAYIEALDESNYPRVGLSISGGGTQSGLGGLGIWQALDGRYEPAVRAGTGGLAQIISYISGLSGGGAVTVALLAANDFKEVSEIRRTADFSNDYTAGRSGNTTEFFTNIFENTGAKAETGFAVSVTDPFGQFWSTWLPRDSVYSNYSAIALPGTAFSKGKGPMPLMSFTEVVPGTSPEINDITYPGGPGWNITAYEVSPFEFGSWGGGRIQAFMPTAHLGTEMDNGKAVNESECVRGFDKLTFIQGTTTNAFPAWFIDDFYEIPIFGKRQVSDDIKIPPEEDQNPLVQLVNETASNFGLTFNQSMWATYPNPFHGFNSAMNNVDELLLIDGSLNGETNPIRPMIWPERELDLVMVYEASSDSEYDWVNGTNLINSALAAHQGQIAFPDIPTVETLVSQNLTRQPTLFGCDAGTETPLVLYLPNAPWTSYSNYSYRTTSFTEKQVDVTLENAFQIATYGDRSVDDAWPACLACASIYKSLKRAKVNVPQQCTQCFERHCWTGGNVTAQVGESDFDLRPRLDPELSYEEWNATVWMKM